MTDEPRRRTIPGRRRQNLARPRTRAAPAPPAARRSAPRPVSQAAYARHRGVSREAVRRALAEGRIEADAQGRIDTEAADVAWERNSAPAALRGARRRRRPDPDESSFAEARARREAWMAELAELNYRQRSGELVPAEDVRRSAFDVGRRLRSQLLTIPDRVAAQLAGLHDPMAVHRVLRAEILKACAEIAGEAGDAESVSPPEEAAPPARARA